MHRLPEKTWFVRLIVATVCWGIQLSNHIVIGADPAPDLDQEAATLVERMLQVNRPWLIPGLIEGSYSLLRKEGGVGNGEVIGPFALETKRTNAVPWKVYTYRVGSIVWTPLHNMNQAGMPYSVRMIGKTNWNNMDLIAVAVTFSEPPKCAISFGGQQGWSYSMCNYRNENARILIEPTNAVPIVIDTSSAGGPATGSGFEATWQFDAGYFTVNGGFAPQALEWNEPTAFRERQEFQIREREWFFKRGTSWRGGEAKWGTPGEVIQSFELVDLTIVKHP